MEGQMNFLRIRSLTINLDRVVYWEAIPKTELTKPTTGPPPGLPGVLPHTELYDDSDECEVHIYMSGRKEPLVLGKTPARAFLAVVTKHVEAVQVPPIQKPGLSARRLIPRPAK
jgi:hypothetical protein